MDITWRILPLIVMVHLKGCLGESVSMDCSPQTVCALRYSNIELMCSYTNIVIKTAFWFNPKQKAKWRNEERPEDLTLDTDYAGRVSTETSKLFSTLTIKDLREKDTGEYDLIIITEKGERLSTGFILTVTDVYVKETKPEVLTCNTSCSLPSDIQKNLFWYQEGMKRESHGDTFVLSKFDKGRFTCSIGFLHSSPLCAFDQVCWSVNYTDTRMCVLEGSSVEITATYTWPSRHTLSRVFWHYYWYGEPRDLSMEEQFAGRVKYFGDKERNWSLRMRDVRKRDSGTYYCRIVTHTLGQKGSGTPGVVLKVTGLHVEVRVSSNPTEGHTVTLTCSSNCTLPNNPTYIWYKDTQLVINKPTRDNKLYLKCSGDTGSYSCAVRGHEEFSSLAQLLNCPEECSVLTLSTVGVSVFVTLVLTAAVQWIYCTIKRKRKTERDPDIQTPNADDTYTALNLTTMSPVYETLQGMRIEAPELQYAAD